MKKITKFFFVLVALCFVSTIFTACGKSSYKLNIEQNPNGSISILNVNGEKIKPIRIQEGSKVELGYEAHPNYVLKYFIVNNTPISGNSFIFPAQDTTISALFELSQYSITYHLNGGQNSNNNPTTHNTSETLILSTPNKLGYQFEGWYDNENFEGNSITKLENITNSEVKLYAKWSNAIDYKITYYDGLTKLKDSIYTIEQSVNIERGPNKSGYEFVGWYNNPSFSGGKVTTIPAGTTGELSLYAKYNTITYQINYYDNASKIDDISYNIEQEVLLLVPEKNGYTFEGWYDNSEFEGNPISVISNSVGNLDFYAKWSLTPYKIRCYDSNKLINEITYYVTSEDIVLENAPIKSGYDFIGWYLTPLLYGQNYTTIFSGNYSDIDFYAKYEKLYSFSAGTINGATDYSIEKYDQLNIPTSIDGVEVTAIANNAFTDFENLKSIVIPSTVISIGTSIFKNIDIENIVIDINNSVYKADSNCIIEKNTNKLIVGCNNSTIPTYITEIGEGAFAYCEKLNEANIPSDVIAIGDDAFYNCINLLEVVIPDSVTSLGESAFCWCDNLKTVTLSRNILSIKQNTFNGCAIKTISIPTSVRTIGAFAFYASDLESLEIPEGVRTISTCAFGSCNNLKNIYISSSVTNIVDFAFSECASVISFTVNENNSVYKSESNCLITKVDIDIFTKKDTLLAGFNSSTIPSGVKVINNSAFYKMESIIDIEIPSSVTTIKDDAFAGTGLVSVVIPRSVKQIDEGAFNCSSLKTIIFEGEEPPYCFFDWCNIDIMEIYVPDDSLQLYKTELGEDFYNVIKPISEKPEE